MALKTITLLICVLALIGCDKPNKPLVKDDLRVEATPILNSQQPDINEGEALLSELKNVNPFFPEHSIGAAQLGQGSGLKGIVWDDLRPYAVIGYQVVVEGDEIDGKKVIKINKSSVELDDNGSIEIIKLK